jgi:hypothetical protein
LSYYLSLIVGELYTSIFILGNLYPKVKVKYPSDPAFSPLGGIGIDMQPLSKSVIKTIQYL